MVFPASSTTLTSEVKKCHRWAKVCVISKEWYVNHKSKSAQFLGKSACTRFVPPPQPVLRTDYRLRSGDFRAPVLVAPAEGRGPEDSMRRVRFEKSGPPTGLWARKLRRPLGHGDAVAAVGFGDAALVRAVGDPRLLVGEHRAEEVSVDAAFEVFVAAV